MKFKVLKNTINDLKSVNTKPKMKDISILTDLSNIKLVSYILLIFTCNFRLLHSSCIFIAFNDN